MGERSLPAADLACSLPAGSTHTLCFFLPKVSSSLPALLVELKWNKPVEGALEQVKERDYPAVLRAWGGKLLLVGISYDEQTKVHTASIEPA